MKIFKIGSKHKHRSLQNNNMTLNEKSIFLNKELRVNVYISEKRNKIIIAPQYAVRGNIVFVEQEDSIVLDFNTPYNELGQGVIDSLHNFENKDLKLKHRTSEDWNAYKQSNEPSKRKFEEVYNLIRVITFDSTRKLKFLVFQCICGMKKLKLVQR